METTRSIVLLALLMIPLTGAADQDFEFFEKEVRPLLVNKCYECHSVDARKLKGGLYLDSREGWIKGGDSGAAIVPGQPDQSLFVEAVRYANSDLEMPPKSKLSDQEIATLVKWVEMGAPDPRIAPPRTADKPVQRGLSLEEGRKFWSYKPPVKTAAPPVKNQTWPRRPLDQFILARLELQDLSPVRDASKGSLARRVYFDLTGLPPTPQQLDQFLDDPGPDALARLVDQLLKSPRFGERWGRHWLDVARYAESVTLRGLVYQNAWRYRDYVINALNDDMPYNQFVREQVAGDLLEGATLADQQRQLIATGFLTLGNINLEEQDKLQLDMNVVDEQLDVLSKAFLGQTVTCARCHDHKFDPIPTRDYYAMAGILKGANMMRHSNVSGWVERPLPLPAEEVAKIKSHAGKVAKLESEIKEVKAHLASLKKASGAQGVSAGGVAVGNFPGIVIDNVDGVVVGDWEDSQYVKPFIGAGYIFDKASGKGEKSVTFNPKLPRAGVYEVRFAYTHGENRPRKAPVTVISAEGRKTTYVDQQKPPPLDRHFVSLGRYRFESDGPASVVVETRGTTGSLIVDAVQFLPLKGNAINLAAEDVELKENDPDREQLLVRTAEAETELKGLQARLKKLKSDGPTQPLVMTVEEKGAGDIRVHVRGSVHTLGELAPRGFLQVAMGGTPVKMPPTESGRRELADWLASADNPLTSRVMVNRVWHWLFGNGLVRTTDNFGTTGQPPTHPELLDWLAIRFQEEGWSVKWLVKEIMLSRVYQLSSAADQAGTAADPMNKLRWRNDRRRLEAEAIRDSMLAISGKLSLDMGGRTFPESVKADYGKVIDSTRRSVYLPVFRNALPELFEAFDFANASMVTGTRNVSTVAPQALFLMNNPFVREQAKAAAERFASGTHDERIRTAYRVTLGRSPSEGEMSLAQKHIGNEHEQRWTELYHALFASMDFRYLD